MKFAIVGAGAIGGLLGAKLALAGEDVTFIAVPDTRVALAEAAAGFYENPARTLGTIGVTGTDDLAVPQPPFVEAVAQPVL